MRVGKSLQPTFYNFLRMNTLPALPRREKIARVFKRKL